MVCGSGRRPRSWYSTPSCRIFHTTRHSLCATAQMAFLCPSLGTSRRYGFALKSTDASTRFPNSSAATAHRPDEGLNLKITGLKTFVVNVGSVNWVFAKVHTNQGLI